jgi:predicted SAM-dependent methyltransferase
MSPERESLSAVPSRLLNFGCGATFHPEWINLDAAPVYPEIIAHDLRRGFPYEAESFDAVYGSHVLEHLDPSAGAQLLRECFRVLKPGGIVRIVVPDLETIARLYLQSLEGALSGDADARMRYEWIMLELYDQATRSSSGGRMAEYLRRTLDGRAVQFVAGRIGAEAPGDVLPGSARSPVPARVPRRARSAANSLRRMLAAGCAFLFMGPEGSAALREGIFRRSGEVHRWMYDRFSLAQALEQAGFVDARGRMADESEIPGFARYGLETLDGGPRKPDSLYLEARKPRLT